MRKKCTKCGKIKPLEDFYKDKRNLNGYTGYCRVCTRQRRLVIDPDCDKKQYAKQKNKTGYKEAACKRAILWNKNNPKRRSAISKKHREKNIEVYRDRSRKWAKENPERIQELARKRYIEKKKHILKLSSEWKKTDAGKRSNKAYWAKRSAAGGSITTEMIKSIEQSNIRKYGILTCEYCKVPVGDKYHLEHKTPISRGGRSQQVNLCIACPECNLSKGTLTASEYRAKLKVI